MNKNLNPTTSALPSSRWLVRVLMLVAVAAGVAVWLRSLEAEGETGAMQAWRFRFTQVKDTVNKAAQKIRHTNPSAKEQILDLESDLQPGG